MPTKKYKSQIYSGAGNTFFILNNKELALNQDEKIKLTVSACSENKIDGFVFIEKPASQLSSFSWDFYNSDGSQANMCGNAARCVTVYAHKNGLADKKVEFDTRVGLVHGEFLSFSEALVVLPLPQEEMKTIEGQGVEAALVNSGVPHAVVEVSDLKNEKELLRIAQMFRRHKDAGLGGANVTFLKKGQNQYDAISFERGVEGFTRACGTGAIAGAYLVYKKSQEKDWLVISMPGGELRVRFDEEQQKTWLMGPVEFISNKDLSLE